MVNEDHVRAAAIVLAIKHKRDCPDKALEVTLSGAVIEELEGESYVITVQPLNSESAESCQLPTTQVKTPASPSPVGEICPRCGEKVHEIPQDVFYRCDDVKCQWAGKLLLT